MSQPTSILFSRAQFYRQQARRARRLAAGISRDVALRLQRYADQLDSAAARMERDVRWVPARCCVEDNRSTVDPARRASTFPVASAAHNTEGNVP